MLESFLILLLFQALGESISYLFSLSIPGPVIGMLLLLFHLVFSNKESSPLFEFSSRFLSHLALLFVPAATGIMLHFEHVRKEWISIIVALSLSTFLSIVVIGLVLKRMKND